MKDLVIGAFDGYSWEDIEPWVVSLERTGYDGNRAVIAYNVKKDVVDKLTAKGYSIFAFERDTEGNIIYPNLQSVVVERFLHYWFFLNKMENIHNVIITDVKDVIFQTDPSVTLSATKFTDSVVVASEGITYKDEPWSRNNMNVNFGTPIYKTLENHEIYCAGVIAGPFHLMMDLCLNIFLLCRGVPYASPGGGGPDQSALNIILNQEVWGVSTFFADPYHDWCIHLGTSRMAVEAGFGDMGWRYKNGDLALDDIDFTYSSLPELIDGKVYPPKVILKDVGKVYPAPAPYAIVHQYNRVPAWNLAEQYREK